MLSKSFDADAKELRISGLVVNRKIGCVFLSVDGKGVYCSSAGANRFTPYDKTWEQVCKLRTEDSKHDVLYFMKAGSDLYKLARAK